MTTKLAECSILVVGAGAIGGYFGGRLAEAGARVSLVARSDYETVRQHGIQIKSIAGNFHFRPDGVYRRAAEAPAADYLLIATKALPEIDLPRLLDGAVGPGTTLLLIQNGIGVEQPLKQAFPHHCLLSATAYIGVGRSAPGVIDHQGGGQLSIGCYPAGRPAELETIVAYFNRAKVKCEPVDDIELCRWLKLCWNVPFNALSVAAGGIDTQTLIQDRPLEELSRQLMEEVIAVAAAAGKAIPAGVIEQNLDYTRNFPAYKTSMLLDFEAGRPLEVEVILGNVLRLARRHQVAVPRLETVYALLSMVDRRNRRRTGHRPE